MFSFDLKDWGKRGAAIAAALWIRQQEFYKNLRSKIAADDQTSFGLDDGVDAVFISLVVEVAQYGTAVNVTRVAKRAALIAAGLWASQQDFYKGLKAKVTEEDPLTFGLDDGFDAAAYSLAVEIGQGFF